MNDPWADARRRISAEKTQDFPADLLLEELLSDADALLAVVRAVQKRDHYRRMHVASQMPPYSEVLDALAALPEHLRAGERG